MNFVPWTVDVGSPTSAYDNRVSVKENLEVTTFYKTKSFVLQNAER